MSKSSSDIENNKKIVILDSSGSSSASHGGGVLQKSKSCNDISMKEFLDFFNTAYQLNKMVEETTQTQKIFEIDWNNLVHNNLTKTSSSITDENSNQNSAEHNNTRRKLHQVLQEGLLDSVLPYLVPKHCSNSTSSSTSSSSVKRNSIESKLRLNVPNHHHHHHSPDRSIAVRRKHLQATRTHKASIKPDVEVDIHVCDEVKGLKRTFRCPQRLLISEMGYFAEVTAGQRLEDMDISVHCDVSNFEWLMQWVKRDPNMKEAWPKLDCSNVVAVLTSAAFLQMDLLLENCLQFCYKKANDILAGPANLSCLNDSVLTRLAAMFSNSEVEKLRDRKDRLQGRLYCKLISALAEQTPEEHRGHFASLSRMFKCSECGKLLVSRTLAPKVPCTCNNTRLTRHGDIQHQHVRSSVWNLSEHVAGLKSEMRSWRKVYWRLWGEAHWLICTVCNCPFSLAETSWCKQHPEPAQFLGAPPQRACGRYSCCGTKVLRFSPVTVRQGCHYDNHIPELSTEKEQSVWSIFQEHKALIIVPPPPPASVKQNTEGNKIEEETSLPCLKLDPASFSTGLLSVSTWEPSPVKRERIESRSALIQARAATTSSCTQQQSITMEQILSSTSNNVLSSSSSSSSSNTSSSDEEEAEDECSQTCQLVRVTARPRTALIHVVTSTANMIPPRTLAGRHWDLNLTTRCNQDDQREYEERATRRLVTWLTRRSNASNHSRSHLLNTPMGGTFVSLEREWRDTHLRNEKSSGNNSGITGSRHRARSSRTTS